MKLLLILLTVFLIRIHIVRGDGCWVNLVCDGTPHWKKITPCNQEIRAEAIKKLYKTQLQNMTDRTVAMSKKLGKLRKMMKLLESRTGEVKAPETTGSDETTCDSTTPSNWKPEVSSVDQTPASQSTEVTTGAEEKEDTSEIDGTPEVKSETTFVDDASEDNTRTNEMTVTANKLEAATDGAGSTEETTVTIADTTLEDTAQNTDIETTGKTTTDIDANTEITSTTFDKTTLEDATQTTNMETTDNCNAIWYKNKCYVPVMDQTASFDGARQICAEMSGNLANIYDETHFNLLMSRIRKDYMNGKTEVSVRLGMTIQPSTGKVTLADGSGAEYLKWKPGYPNTGATYTTLFLRVHTSESGIYNYMFNYLPSYTGYNLLCEI